MRLIVKGRRKYTGRFSVFCRERSAAHAAERFRSRRRWASIACALLAACLLLGLLPGEAGRAEAGQVLNVALYPVVPDQTRFQQAVEAVWKARHPEVELSFVDWNSYLQDPPEDLDVFVYDSIFLYDFLEKGCLLPLGEEDIRDADDFITCALSACRVDGTAYALPQLLCTDLLFARKDDAEVAKVENIRELYQVIGDSAAVPVPPAEGEGLLLSMPDTMAWAFWYLEIQTDVDQDYSEWASLPEADALDPEVMSYMQMTRDMAGDGLLSYVSPEGDAYVHGAWFAQGRGRAYIGVSEAMADMGDAAKDMVFRRISLSDREDVPMLYADVASVNARISDEKKPLALELLNVITGTEALTAAFAPGRAGQSAQYLLAARTSVYDALSENDPIYSGLKEIVSDPKCRVFIVRPSARALLAQAASSLAQP